MHAWMNDHKEIVAALAFLSSSMLEFSSYVVLGSGLPSLMTGLFICVIWILIILTSVKC